MVTSRPEREPGWLRQSALVAAGLGAVGALAAGRLAGPVAAGNFAAGAALSLGLLAVLQWCTGGWRRARRFRRRWLFVLLLPKYALIAAGLYLAVRADCFRGGWFVGGFVVLHGVWLLEAVRALSSEQRRERPQG
jgi:hypothetical protein